ncbi:hypothetical protein F2P81_020076 [Scophthalmus maximus]|uniref:UPAR/Ly6 domain-containing protein n=1 Tax=Scophthalmus maximus TaxID=52904 RepID=A0A6A4S511_SCOMX|nr:hypothetical protein F2P81_020076 [Scophthalmus maximus]
MGAAQHCPLLLLSLVLLATNGEALQCFTCMGSNNEDCNRQGSKSCPSYSDACAAVVGHDTLNPGGSNAERSQVLTADCNDLSCSLLEKEIVSISHVSSYWSSFVNNTDWKKVRMIHHKYLLVNKGNPLSSVMPQSAGIFVCVWPDEPGQTAICGHYT